MTHYTYTHTHTQRYIYIYFFGVQLVKDCLGNIDFMSEWSETGGVKLKSQRN